MQVLYVVDSLGFRALMRPDTIRYEDARTILVNGERVSVPARAVMADARGSDTLIIELTIDDATGTDTRTPLIERGESAAARMLDRPYFIQMKGTARIRGRLGGVPSRCVARSVTASWGSSRKATPSRRMRDSSNPPVCRPPKPRSPPSRSTSRTG